MDLNTYARRKQSILNRMLAALLYVFQSFIRGYMSAREWNDMMTVTYRVMKPYRDEGTQLAREFYDSNRAAQLPDKDRHDIFTDDFYPERWYREAMMPVYQATQQGASPEVAVEEAVARVTKVYEDAQRRTLIQGVRDDVGQPIRGFARFDPRPPTCAFCTMMISRGPVYHEGNAGFPFDTERLERLILDDKPDEINELMNKWHPKCTCIVVPVYKYDNYPTQEQEKEAFEIYKKARKKVSSQLRVGESKNNTRLILNEMRKLIYSKADEQDETTLGTNVA